MGKKILKNVYVFLLRKRLLNICNRVESCLLIILLLGTKKIVKIKRLSNRKKDLSFVRNLRAVVKYILLWKKAQNTENKHLIIFFTIK